MNTIDAKDFLFTLKKIKKDPSELEGALLQAEARLSEKDCEYVSEKVELWEKTRTVK
jgi:hypothetical protein